ITAMYHFPLIGFENDRSFVRLRCQMPVQTIPRNVQLTIVEPLVKRRIGVIQYTRKRLMPDEVLPCEFCPEAGVITLSFTAQSLISLHTGHIGAFDKFSSRGKNPGFMQDGFDRSHAVPCSTIKGFPNCTI